MKKPPTKDQPTPIKNRQKNEKLTKALKKNLLRRKVAK